MKTFVRMVMAVLILAGSAARAGEGNLPPGVIAISDAQMTWEQAKAFCEQHGGRMPLIGGLPELGTIDGMKKGYSVDGFGMVDDLWPDGLPFDRYWTGTGHSADPYSRWYATPDNWSMISKGGPGGKVSLSFTAVGATSRAICVAKDAGPAVTPPAPEPKDYTDQSEIRGGLNGGNIMYPDKGRYYLENDPQETPFTGTVKRWWRNQKDGRIEWVAVLEGGYVMSQTNYYDEPEPVVSEEQFMEMLGDTAIITVMTYHRNGKPKAMERFKVARGNADRRLKDGDFKGWRDNGNLSEEMTYVNNLLEGAKREYNRDGKLVTETEYRGGKKNGMLREYDAKTGERTKEVPFVDDLEDGVRKDYRDDGVTLRFTQEFKKGKPDGPKDTYDRDGKNVTKTEMFKDGRPVKE